MMWDGAAGIASVVRQGGMTIVQHETGCGHFDMPAAALDLGGADVALTPPQIARALQVLAGETRAAA
ncbi:MAG: chemotaxis protein CheB, partial [Acetobacteraceae bacterium]